MMDFYINFTLDEEFNETVQSPIHEDFSYASFSEGEKMRIDLALLFTWREVARMKNSVSTNLLIMDEVFDSSLDGFGTDEFLKIVRFVIKDANIFIISHKESLYDKFESVIKFEKVKGFSRDDLMPVHKDTGKKVFFAHIPRTAGRFVEANLSLNGFEWVEKHLDTGRGTMSM